MNKLPKYDFDDSKAEKIIKDKSIPLWYRILNLDEKHFEHSEYAGTNKVEPRIKDLNILRKLAPRVYETCVDEIKEDNNYDSWDGKKKRKIKLGKKIGSIPLLDFAYHPELANDPKALNKYFIDHPEYKIKQ